MTQTFLGELSSHLLDKFGNDISEITFVFPNRRPADFLFRELSNIIDKPIPAPSFLTIEDFISRYSDLTPLPQTNLLVSLFETWKTLQPESDFEKYYSWGQLMLSDYDEIDKNLVSAGTMFRHLEAAKKIENEFLPIEEKSLQSSFIRTWSLYSKAYYLFREKLFEKRKGYWGMLFRDVAEKVENNAIDIESSYFIFCGFNALSKAEEIIISSLINERKAEIFWDSDKYYIENQNQDAGTFIRRSMKAISNHGKQLFTDNLSQSPISVSLIGAPLNIGQVKALCSELFASNAFKNSTSTAIILPDENLLIPLIHALPGFNENKYTITPGLSLSDSLRFSFFNSWFNLISNYRADTDDYYFKDLCTLLEMPYMAEYPITVKILETIRENNWVYVPRKHIRSLADGIPEIIFSIPNTSAEILESLKTIHSKIPEFQGNTLFPENEVMEGFNRIFDSLLTLIKESGLELTTAGILKLINKESSQLQIAMDVNPKHDTIQVMGVLESRSIDFENVFILSLNEGTFPVSQLNHSYIPFDIRKQFDLPTNDENQTISSYYFYRLLQRAKNVYLFYNSESGKKGTEKSRFIRQIETFLAKGNPSMQLNKKSFVSPLPKAEVKPIKIRKTDNFYEVLKSKAITGISPSFIISYSICPLQATMQSIFKIEAPDDIGEDMDAGEFGTLYHSAMELIYSPFKGKTVSSGELKTILENIDGYISSAIRKHFKEKAEYIFQNDSLKIVTIKTLVKKSIERDFADVPFKILDTEVTIEKSFKLDDLRTIRLKGKIDRVDEKDGAVRILDYKTGRVIEDKFNYTDQEELRKHNKESFQTLFYSWLYASSSGQNEITPTILPLKSVMQGRKVVNIKIPFNATEFKKFELHLKKILEEIFNPDIEITQTEDLDNCEYCPYKNLCLR